MGAFALPEALEGSHFPTYPISSVPCRLTTLAKFGVRHWALPRIIIQFYILIRKYSCNSLTPSLKFMMLRLSPFYGVTFSCQLLYSCYCFVHVPPALVYVPGPPVLALRYLVRKSPGNTLELLNVETVPRNVTVTRLVQLLKA